MPYLAFIWCNTMLSEELRFSNREKLIVRELSTNARVSLTQIGKVARCSPVTATKIIGKLTKQLDMRFTLEIDLDRLGLAERHVITVKFSKKPDERFLQNFFQNDPYAQDVYLTKGDFDLLVLATADTPVNYIKWETDLGASLSEYLPDLKPSEFVFPQLGYIPLNDIFTDFIRDEIKTDKKDKLILKTLNNNSRMSYREIGRQLGINEDTIRYRIFKLMHKGIISRFTIAIQNPGYGHLVAYLMRYKFNKNTTTNAFPQMRRHYMTDDESVPLLNGFQLIAPISGSYRSFGMAFDKDEKTVLYKSIKWHKNVLSNELVRIRHAEVIKPLKGLLPLRSLDVKANYKFIWS